MHIFNQCIIYTVKQQSIIITHILKSYSEHNFIQSREIHDFIELIAKNLKMVYFLKQNSLSIYIQYYLDDKKSAKFLLQIVC